MALSEVARLGALVGAARHAVVFTGAGMSTESGIPDFRSPGGVWSRMKPILYDEFLTSEAKRREAWGRAFSGAAGWVGASPNDGHRAIAALVAAGPVIQVITQNVDNLHQESGVPAERVIELHGNASYAMCLDCGRRYELADLKPGFVERGIVPVCAVCGGLIKTAVVSFGQPMPEAAMRRAEAATLASDLFIVLGSSLTVYPAAGFPRLAKENGARLAIVNREPTPLDRFADLVIHAELGAVLNALVTDP